MKWQGISCNEPTIVFPLTILTTSVKTSWTDPKPKGEMKPTYTAFAWVQNTSSARWEVTWDYESSITELFVRPLNQLFWIPVCKGSGKRSTRHEESDKDKIGHRNNQWPDHMWTRGNEWQSGRIIYVISRYQSVERRTLLPGGSDEEYAKYWMRWRGQKQRAFVRITPRWETDAKVSTRHVAKAAMRKTPSSCSRENPNGPCCALKTWMPCLAATTSSMAYSRV